MSAEHPFVIDGVRHDSDCEILRTPAFQAQRRACTCGASWRENMRHAEAVERERIACMVERLDNTMMDQDKLAAYIRGEETP